MRAADFLITKYAPRSVYYFAAAAALCCFNDEKLVAFVL